MREEKRDKTGPKEEEQTPPHGFVTFLDAKRDKTGMELGECRERADLVHTDPHDGFVANATTKRDKTGEMEE